MIRYEEIADATALITIDRPERRNALGSQVMEELAAAAGLSFKIAVVEGDDLMDRLGELAGRGLTEMFTDAEFPDPKRVFTANAYFGGRPIADPVGEVGHRALEDAARGV